MSHFTAYRSLSRARGRERLPTLGRPKLSRNQTSDRNKYVTHWLREVWGKDHVDWDPSGKQYLGAIDVTRISAVYPAAKAFIKERGLGNLSLTTFRRLWDEWMDKDRIRMRRKKNVSGKCTGMFHSSHLY